MPLPAGYELGSWYQPLAISPDGRLVVYAARDETHEQLYLRNLDRIEAAPVPGTEGGSDPFFSPDGRWLAFFSGGELKKVEVAGGIPQTICDATQGSRGGTWGPDGDIVFAVGTTSGLLRVPSGGGRPEALTVPDAQTGEIGHLWPQYLPGGRDVLFTIWAADGWRSAVLSTATGTWRVVLEGGAAARYVSTGHLLFAEMTTAQAGPNLLAAPFHPSDRHVEGISVSVLEEPGLAGPNFAVSSNGTLIYVAGGSRAWAGLAQTSLVWRDREGRVTPALDHPGYFQGPRVSPDGKRIATPDFSPGGTVDVWVFELARGVSTRVSFSGSINNFPAWTPDGTALAFNSSRLPPASTRRPRTVRAARQGSFAGTGLLRYPARGRRTARCSPTPSWTHRGRGIYGSSRPIRIRHRSWPLRPTSSLPCSLPTGRVWPTSPTRPGRTRSTCATSRGLAAPRWSPRGVAGSPCGHGMVGSSTTVTAMP